MFLSEVRVSILKEDRLKSPADRALEMARCWYPMATLTIGRIADDGEVTVLVELDDMWDIRMVRYVDLDRAKPLQTDTVIHI